MAPRRIEPASSDALLARIRLVHPFPSLLDGAVVGAVALVGGAGASLALVLAASMTLLQFAIGALNDAVDAPRDAGRRDGKPIPAGLVSIRTALAVAGLCAAGGLMLAFAGGPGLGLLALVGLAIGAWYDLAAKGTTLSWLPLALGVPLLPIYGWFGATGGLPGVFLVLVPAAANAGAALAIANAIVDMDRDVAAGMGSIAIALGARRASLLVLVLHLVVAALAASTAVAIGAPRGWVAILLATTLAPLGGALYGVVAAGRPGTGGRELAWEIQAVGTGLLAVAWVSAMSASAGALADG